MATIAIEIHDAGILARSTPADLTAGLAPSPGYALIDGDVPLTGPEAAARARLQPKQIHNRFWADLDTSPMARPFPAGMSHADLAHTHLGGVWQQLDGAGAGEVLLVVPGSYSGTQLGLILGIARACGMPVRGMIDAAVAAAAAITATTPLLHLDLELHRAVLTEMVAGEELVRRRVEVMTQTGLALLQERWMRCIAEIFVRHTRFDPLHTAAAEQELHAALPGLLRELCGAGSVTFGIDAGGRTHAVELARPDLIAAVEDSYRLLVHQVGLWTRAGQEATLLLSHQAASLPGLREQLSEVGGTRIVVLPEGAAADSALAQRDLIHSEAEALPFIIRLPRNMAPQTGAGDGGLPVAESATADVPPVTSPAAELPTHLLHGARAHVITSEPLLLGIAIPADRRGFNVSGPTAGISRSHCSIYRDGRRVMVEDHSTHGSFLNGQRIDGRAELAVGDRLRLGSPGVEVLLISVAASGGRDDG